MAQSAPAPVREKLIPQVKHIVAVASGKGGVGKSTVSANLALALAAQGASVGLMDADVYGPSIPTILGISERPLATPENRILPVVRYGLKVISMAFFVPANDAVIWRGPMLHKMVQDFLGVVDWGELDYLIVDLPPGTGDIQLSLCQTIPLTGAVIVSTPQDVAWNVAQKAIVMFDKLNTPVLGILENMSYYACPHCGERDDLFGSGGAKNAAQRLAIPFLGEIPLVSSMRRSADQGDPLMHSDPHNPTSVAIARIAANLVGEVARRDAGNSGKIIPVRLSEPGQTSFSIEWNDGKKTLYSGRQLRAACPCAACVNEVTGERLLNPANIPAEVRVAQASPVGRYALNLVFGDGHGTGLYSFQLLRKLADG